MDILVIATLSILIISSIFLGMLILFLIQLYNEVKCWNKGKCPDCGESWRKPLFNLKTRYKQIYECNCDMIFLRILNK